MTARLLAALLAFMPLPLLAQPTPPPLPAAVIEDPAPNPAAPAGMEAFQIVSHGSAMNAILYRAAGSGAHKTMLLFHGFPGNEQNLDLAQAMRRAGWNVLTFHYRGAWGSHGRFSFANAMADAKVVLAWAEDPDNVRAHGIDSKRIIVAGHSMGGLMAAQAAAADPQVWGTVLIDPWDIAQTGRDMQTPAGRAATVKMFAEDVPPLAGTSVAKLMTEVSRGNPAFDLAAAMPKLASRPLLILGAQRGGGAMSIKLADAARAAGATRLDAAVLPTDHSFSDSRIALAGRVLTWADALVNPAVDFAGRYDEGNVFARILRGEVPIAKVYEDAEVLAFMDNAPRSSGHVLVISKTSKARNALEMDDTTYARLMAIAKRIAAADRIALGADGVVIQQNNGVAQSVPHLHVHVMPVYRGVPLKAAETTKSTLPELEAVAAKLRAGLRP